MLIKEGKKKEKPILLFVEKYLLTLITNCNEKVKRISHRNVIRMIGLKEKKIMILLDMNGPSI